MFAIIYLLLILLGSITLFISNGDSAFVVGHGGIIGVGVSKEAIAAMAGLRKFSTVSTKWAKSLFSPVRRASSRADAASAKSLASSVAAIPLRE
jgi:hypothetical protein